MDIVEQLRRQADECANAFPTRNGWGNTMRVAAEEIEQLRHVIAANNGEKSKLWRRIEELERLTPNDNHERREP